MGNNTEKLGGSVALGASKGPDFRSNALLRSLTIAVATLVLSTCTTPKDEAAAQDEISEVASQRGALSKWSYGFNNEFNPDADPQMTKTLSVTFQQANEEAIEEPIEVRVWVSEGGDEEFDYGTAEVTIGEEFEFKGLPVGATEVYLEPTDGSEGAEFLEIVAEDF
ncbi:hypothetical protein JKY72_04075 [Candidatus Gracilibacteria bacterium]|nr:hypothetical protein [Candidatus Gracilibacteria bacterium]